MQGNFFGMDVSKVKLPSLRVSLASRPQVMRFVIACGVVSALLLLGGVTPLVWRRVSLSRQIAATRATIAPEFQKSELELKQQLEREQANRKQLAVDWSRISTKLASFKQAYDEIARDPRRVDYKRERYNILGKLGAKAREANATIPKYDPDPLKNKMGIPLDVTVADDPARRMIQLKGAGALMGAALDWGMVRVESVRLLEPIERSMIKQANQTEPFAVELPMEVVAVGDVQALGRWILAVSNAKDLNGKQSYFFIVRNMKAEKASPSEPEYLRATMVFTAVLVFKSPQEFEPPKEIKRKAADDA